MNPEHIPSKRALGTQYEVKASLFIEKLGYLVLDRNVNYRWGEIDLIAVDPFKSDLVFIEVRYRGENAMLTPAESITYTKQQRLKRAIETYLVSPQFLERGLKLEGIRIDLIGFELEVISHVQSFI